MERGEKQGQDASPGLLAASGSLSLCCRRSGFQSLSFSASDEKIMHLAKEFEKQQGVFLPFEKDVGAWVYGNIRELFSLQAVS